MRARLLDPWTRKAARRRNRTFLDAAMAAAALVATADEEVRLSEQLALDDALDRIDKLQVYEPGTAADLNRRFVEAIEADRAAGRQQALEALSRFEGDRDDRQIVLYVAAVIARADLELSSSEEETLQEIAERLDLPAHETLSEIWGAVTPS